MSELKDMPVVTLEQVFAFREYAVAENAKLREQLAFTKDAWDKMRSLAESSNAECAKLRLALEAAEAKLKELSEQEPDGILVECIAGAISRYITQPLVQREVIEAAQYISQRYASKTPPADVQELQKQNNTVFASLASAERRIAELKHKLAEQQPCPAECWQLAQAREEGRKEAVPEIANLRGVDLRGDFAVQLVFSSCRAASAFADAVLSSAPKPEVKP